MTKILSKGPAKSTPSCAHQLRVLRLIYGVYRVVSRVDALQ